MDLMQAILRRLTPPIFGDRVRGVVDAIAGSAQDLYDYIRNTIRESNAGTAEDTLPQWYAMLGMTYDESIPLSQRQSEAQQRSVARGSSTQAILEQTIQIAFPGLQVETGTAELTATEYRVFGEITSASQENQLLGLLERFGPAEMQFRFEPVEIINPLADTDDVDILDTDDLNILGRITLHE